MRGMLRIAMIGFVEISQTLQQWMPKVLIRGIHCLKTELADSRPLF